VPPTLASRPSENRGLARGGAVEADHGHPGTDEGDPPADGVQLAGVQPEPTGLSRYLPAVIREATLGPGRRGLRVLVTMAVLVALVAGFAAWRARPAAEPVTPAPVVQPTASASTGQTVVAVSGKVRRPGLVRLPAGSRVADALQAAGGALPGTDLSSLNLARRLVDGELITVGASAAAAGDAAPGASAPAGTASGQPLDLNTATADQLDALPGVGPVLAQNIVSYRTEHGGFRAVDELRQVDGIGDSRYERLKDLVRI
jgi:competence protein ComEA